VDGTDPGTVTISASDAAALIGVVARLQGESMLGQLDPDVEAAFAKRLRKDGLIDAADAVSLQAGLDALGVRLREALGEQDDGS
jgi:hypothetical protein